MYLYLAWAHYGFGHEECQGQIQDQSSVIPSPLAVILFPQSREKDLGSSLKVFFVRYLALFLHRKAE